MFKRDEIFHAIRWYNLLAALFGIYLFSIGYGYHFIGISALNFAIWAFTRRVSNEL